LVFSPLCYPESNGSVERFHQDYQVHVWQDTYLSGTLAVQAQADQFFARYRHSGHHSALQEQTPHQVHYATPPPLLEMSFSRSPEKRPLYAGRLHFIRRVQPDGTVSVLNVSWSVPAFEPLKGLWVTLDLQPAGSTLTLYDAGPDVPQRHRLGSYPFPVKEAVLPRPTKLAPLSQPVESNQTLLAPTGVSVPASLALWRWLLPQPLSHAIAHSSRRLILATWEASSRLAHRIGDTIY